MGSFEGHVLPGTFFLAFGIWWTYSMFCRYFKVLIKRSVKKNEIIYECTPTYQSSCCPNIPIEGYVKIIATLIGVVSEWVTAIEGGKFVHIGNAQHMTMYIFFGINGITDVLIFHGFPLPNGSDYFTLSLATAIEALLFCFHLHGRTVLDVHVHTLLIISVFASCISCLTEWKYRYNMLSSYLRALCALLQGTWFYQVGFTLYPPFSGSKPSDEHNHRQLMIITTIFCGHIAAIMLFMGFVGYCFYINNRSLLNDTQLHPIRNSYSDIKYKNLENDVSIGLLPTNIKNKQNNNLYNNKNTDESKYSLSGSADEEV